MYTDILWTDIHLECDANSIRQSLIFFFCRKISDADILSTIVRLLLSIRHCRCFPFGMFAVAIDNGDDGKITEANTIYEGIFFYSQH